MLQKFCKLQKFSTQCGLWGRDLHFPQDLRDSSGSNLKVSHQLLPSVLGCSATRTSLFQRKEGRVDHCIAWAIDKVILIADVNRGHHLREDFHRMPGMYHHHNAGLVCQRSPRSLWTFIQAWRGCRLTAVVTRTITLKLNSLQAMLLSQSTEWTEQLCQPLPFSRHIWIITFDAFCGTKLLLRMRAL